MKKDDLIAKVNDSKSNKAVELSYNVKSNLGANPTLLNASDHTNFIYELTNITDNIINQSNAISTLKKGQNGHRTKLIDSCNFLLKNKVNIKFEKIESTIFYNNLQLIDSKLGEILGEILLLSYIHNNKNFSDLLSYLIKDATSKTYYEKKIGDFANAVTFGMYAGKKWNGKNVVNGGIISITNKGQVCLLDLVYFKDIVNTYLRNNIYLESPSSTRYKMFQIYKENNKYYMKLNLQVRCK